MANTCRSAGLASMEGEGAAVDARLSVVFILGRSTAVQVEVVPHAVGFDRVLGTGHDHVPILDDGLIELKVSNEGTSELERNTSFSYIIGNRFPGIVTGHAWRV